MLIIDANDCCQYQLCHAFSCSHAIFKQFEDLLKKTFGDVDEIVDCNRKKLF